MIKRDEDTVYAEGCGYTGQDFGAPYNDSTCIDGFLWDLDSCDEPGGGLTQGGDIPCPQCSNATPPLDDRTAGYEAEGEVNQKGQDQ